MKGFLISSTSSGVGKTTATLAIAAAFRKRGMTVQLFKGGPDFLDTGHHSRIAGRKSRNIDTWMFTPETNRSILHSAAEGADVFIVEGMMGLFDGKSGAGEKGSSAEIAKLLKLPIVLIVDASKSARSVAAIVLGFEMFDPDLKFGGVIFNRIANERHFRSVAEAVRERCKTPVLGWLPVEPAIAIPERHLGLQSVESMGEQELNLDTFGDMAESHIALDELLALECGMSMPQAAEPVPRSSVDIRIGVPYDAAFSFYYEDNLELLREQGAEIVFFSPQHDECLPDALDALYIGGGYPELYAEALSANLSMRLAIRDFAASQRPTYAECGGMMYLMASLTLKDGSVYPMAGVISADVEMTSRLQRFGYVSVEFTRDCILGPKRTVIRGHSFHYSNVVMKQGLTSSYRVDYSLSGRCEDEGYGMPETNILASYVHLPFRANPVVARNFVTAARMFKQNLSIRESLESALSEIA